MSGVRAFVRAQDGNLPGLHAALALARAVAFSQRSGGQEAEQQQDGAAASGKDSAGGGSILRDFTFAKGSEHKRYLGHGSITFSSPDALTNAIRRQTSSSSNSNGSSSARSRYFKPDLVPPRVSASGAAAATSSSSSMVRMVGLADVAPLIGLPSDISGESLSGSPVAATAVEARDGPGRPTSGEWLDYKIERRTSEPIPRMLSAGESLH